MGFTFITKHPAWLVILCVVLAGAYAFFLYYRDTKLKSLAIWKIRTMMAFRFISVFLIAILLLAPLIRRVNEVIQKPVIVFAQDNSQSLMFSGDSSYIRNQYHDNLKALRENLQDQFRVRYYSFGEEFKTQKNFTFNENRTDFSGIFTGMQNKYSSREIGGVVIASDGIYNKGMDPLYSASSVSYPVYTVAMGDTIPETDVRITDIQVNEMAFLGNQFPVKFFVAANRIPENEKLTITITHKGEDVYKDSFITGKKAFTVTDTALLEAKNEGIQHYTVTVDSVAGESNLRNNSREFVMEVIDNKQKILMLANSPHPDLGAIQKVIGDKRNYEVTYSLLDDFSGEVKEYNLVVLHQLPAVHNPASELLKSITEAEIPVLYILGSQSRINAVSQNVDGVTIEQSQGKFDEVYPAFNASFTLFNPKDDFEDYIQSLPPLTAPFAEYALQGNFEILLSQKVHDVATEKPLVAYSANNAVYGSKQGFIFGEGIWRWRLYDYLQNNNHEQFNFFINKTIQYLALRSDKQHLVIDHDNVYNENENIYFEAEVYNESFEPVRNAEVNMVITDNEGHEYNFDMTPADDEEGSYYMLNAGIFQKGDYNYNVTAELGSQTYEQSGTFTVLPLKIEAVKTDANHNLMYKLANEHGGKMFYPEAFEELQTEIANNESIKPIIHTREELTQLINLKGLFFVILLLLGLEWFYRKYQGAY